MFMLKKVLGCALLAALSAAPAVLAHGGESHDPLHQHRAVQGVEVTFQVKSRAQYEAWLRSQGVKATLPAASQVLMVILDQKPRWLETRVKLKLTDAAGQAVGAASGLSPVAVKHKLGPHYAFPVSLKAKQTYFAMVQFEHNGLQRTGFSFKLP